MTSSIYNYVMYNMKLIFICKDLSCCHSNTSSNGCSAENGKKLPKIISFCVILSEIGSEHNFRVKNWEKSSHS